MGDQISKEQLAHMNHAAEKYLQTYPDVQVNPNLAGQAGQEVTSKAWIRPYSIRETETIMRDGTSFTNELKKLISRYSEENRSNTPDFILANYLVACLDAFNASAQAREKWYGR